MNGFGDGTGSEGRDGRGKGCFGGHGHCNFSLAFQYPQHSEHPLDSSPSRSNLNLSSDTLPARVWDEFVESSPGGTYCHLSGWAEIMRDVLGHEAHLLHVRRESAAGTEADSQAGKSHELVGVLPLVWVRSRLFGAHLISMPFLNYGGPLGSEEARRMLAQRALAEARRGGADLLELRERDAAGDSGSLEALEPAYTITGRKITVVLPLPGDPEVLWKDGLKSKVRSQVRRPMKAGLTTRFGSDEIDAFYQVFLHTMRDLGTPVLPRALFQALPEVFGDRVRFCVVYRDDEPVAAGCGFFCSGEFEITWAGSLREHSRVAPNMLLYWALMEHAIEAGARTFNFGRCTPDTGSHRFKAQWGGQDEPLPWAAWSPIGTLATPNPSQGRFALAVRLWKRLPLPVTRVLGPPLARRIP